VLALWKGNTATMLRVFPYSGIQFMVFERAKGHFLREHERGIYLFADTTNERKFGLTAMESLLAGMIAGTCSVICTYPLDLARAQLAVLKRHTEPSFVNQGFTGVMTNNYTQRGVRGLVRGLSPTLLGILPYSGMAFCLNEQGKREVRAFV
jgi:solute carrier family 25 protein 42